MRTQEPARAKPDCAKRESGMKRGGWTAALSGALLVVMCVPVAGAADDVDCTVGNYYVIAAQQRTKFEDALRAESDARYPGWRWSKRPRILSRTTALYPTNRARTDLGVGETVVLQIYPEQKSTVFWFSGGGGSLGASSGNRVTFTAPDREATVTVTATLASGKVLSKRFKVLEPSGVLVEMAPFSTVYHRQGVPSAGFCASIFLTPSTVSFENVELREGEAEAVADGFLGYLNGLKHLDSGGWTLAYGYFPQKGTLGAADKIQGVAGASAPYSRGSFRWSIPWWFRVPPDGEPKMFFTAQHVMLIDGAGTLTISKEQHSESKPLNAASSDYWIMGRSQ
jgi:hypothetical protein